MLPPIDESILQANPKFAALHTTLTTAILNPNGTTKKLPAQKERDAVSEALKEARILAAKRNLIRSALTNLDLSPPPPSTSTNARSNSTEPPLPADLIETILLLSSHLSHPNLPSPSLKLLQSTTHWSTTLPTHLPLIGTLISTYLHTQCLALARIQSPTTNPSYLHRSIPKLAPSIQATRAQIASKEHELRERRTALVATTTSLLQGYQMAIAATVQVLEGVKHGEVARLARARAGCLVVGAEVAGLEAREKVGRGERLVFTEEVGRGLGNYVRHLRDGVERLGERERGARRVLWGYGVGREGGGDEDGEGNGGKERVMREIARVYGGLVQELEEVRRDVERLKGK